jgi:hypothetical protein
MRHTIVKPHLGRNKKNMHIAPVTRLMVECSVRICSALGFTCDAVEACASNKRHTLPRNLCTPSTLRVLHTFVSRRGPMNISYSRSESAPDLRWRK